MIDALYVAFVGYGARIKHMDDMLGLYIGSKMYEIHVGLLPGSKGNFIFEETKPKSIKNKNDVLHLCRFVAGRCQTHESGEMVVLFKKKSYFISVKRVA